MLSSLCHSLILHAMPFENCEVHAFLSFPFFDPQWLDSDLEHKVLYYLFAIKS